MSEDKAPEAAEAAPAASGPSKGPLLLALVNTLAVLGATGTLYYTKILFKRPAITEDLERKRLEEAHKRKTVTEATAPITVPFEPVTVNIESFPAPTGLPDDEGPAPIKGHMHYVSMAFAIEIVDGGQKPAIEVIRPVVMDQLLTLLAHKPYHELTTVQGRYALRTQILEMVNRLTASLPSHPPLLASAVKTAKPKGEGHGGEGHGEGGEGKSEGAEGHGEGAEGGEGKGAKKEAEPAGPPIRELYRDGLVSNVFFTQFVVQ